MKKSVLKNSQENTSARVFFVNKVAGGVCSIIEIGSLAHACNFIKKEALAQVFSSELCEIFKNTFF